MLTVVQESKIKKLIDAQVVAQEEFTAFDITKMIRKSEYVLHADVRDYLHSLMQDYIQLNEYNKELYTDPAGWQAWKYVPVASQDSIQDSINAQAKANIDNNVLIIDEDDDEDDEDDEEDEHEAHGEIFFDVGTLGRVSIPAKFFGDNDYPEVFVYLNADDILVVTTDVRLIKGNTSPIHKISKIENAYRFSVNPHSKNLTIDPDYIELDDIVTDSLLNAVTLSFELY